MRLLQLTRYQRQRPCSDPEVNLGQEMPLVEDGDVLDRTGR
ncbi:hypothetical protein [Amycolatopsis sp. WAC 04182]|nr:hypothetical protein [Amycolatopsis sp. WAC 04182]